MPSSLCSKSSVRGHDLLFALVPALVLSACGASEEALSESPLSTAALELKIDDRVIRVDLDAEMRRFASMEALVDWLDDRLPVEAVVKDGRTVGYTLESSSKVSGKLFLDGQTVTTELGVVALIGGLYGEVEIEGQPTCLDVDGVCDGTLAKYFGALPIETDGTTGIKRSSMKVQNQCSGPDSNRFCIEGKTERFQFNLFGGLKYTRHYTYTEITRGGESNSEVVVFGGLQRAVFDPSSISADTFANPTRVAFGANAKAEFAREAFLVLVQNDDFVTNIVQHCSFHRGFRRNTPIIRLATEWNDRQAAGRPGLVQCQQQRGPPPIPDLPPDISITCNGEFTNPVINCSVSSVSSPTWTVRGVRQPQWDGRSRISFGCMPGATSVVAVSGRVGGRAGSGTTTARCRTTSR